MARDNTTCGRGVTGDSVANNAAAGWQGKHVVCSDGTRGVGGWRCGNDTARNGMVYSVGPAGTTRWQRSNAGTLRDDVVCGGDAVRDITMGQCRGCAAQDDVGDARQGEA